MQPHTSAQRNASSSTPSLSGAPGASERRRHLEPTHVTALQESGVFRLWVPEQYGGAQATVQQGLDAIRDAAYQDGAAGWCVMIANTTALLAARLDPVHAETIYGAPEAVTGGMAAPLGRARIVPGGLEVTGHWAWGSGIHHCTHFGGGCVVVDDDGEPAATSDGARAPFVFFTMDQVEILDTWHTSGLRGTGSTDYEVQRAFVPQGRWVDMQHHELRVDDPLYRFSLFGALALGVAAVGLGLAHRAIQELIDLGAKVPAGSRRSLAERPAVQADLARAEAETAAADAFMRKTVADAWDHAAAHGVQDAATRRALRLAANHAITACTRAVDLCYTAGGGAAVYETNALQCIFRDMHVATQHAMTAPRVYEPLGRMGFGLETSADML